MRNGSRAAKEQDFMAFLGISRLTGVVVSQSVVLFEFIEANHESVEHIIEKIGVSDRVQAAVWAVRQGVVEIEM
jgi:hypothetical protein